MTGTVIRGRPGLTAATKLLPEPPTLEYFAERQRLGIPSHAHALLVACPWCGASGYQSCRVKATGRRVLNPHDARVHAAEAAP